MGRYHKQRQLSARGMRSVPRMTMGVATESDQCAPSKGEEQHAADGDRRVVEVVAGDGVRLRFEPSGQIYEQTMRARICPPG